MRLWRSSRAKETRENWDLNVTATVEGRDRRCFPFQLCFISCVCEGRKTHKKYHISPEKNTKSGFVLRASLLSMHQAEKKKTKKTFLGTPRCDDCSKSPRHKKQQLPQFGWRVGAFEAFGLANGADRGSLERNYYFFKRTWQKILSRVSKSEFFTTPTLVTRISRAAPRTSDTESEKLKMFLVSCCFALETLPSVARPPSISCHVRLTAEERWQKNCWTINLTKICHDVQREWKENKSFN